MHRLGTDAKLEETAAGDQGLDSLEYLCVDGVDLDVLPDRLGGIIPQWGIISGSLVCSCKFTSPDGCHWTCNWLTSADTSHTISLNTIILIE